MLTLLDLKKKIQKLQKEKTLPEAYKFYDFDTLNRYSEHLELFLLLNNKPLETILHFLPAPKDYNEADKNLSSFIAFLIKFPKKDATNLSKEFIKLAQRITDDPTTFTNNEQLNKLLKLLQYHKVISKIILDKLPREKPEDYVRSVYQLFDTGKGNTSLENLDRVSTIKQLAPDESKKRETYLKEWVGTIETLQGYSKQKITSAKLLDLCIDVTKKLLASTLKDPGFASKLPAQAMQHLFDLNIAPDLINEAAEITPKKNDVLPDVTVNDDRYFICKLSKNDIRALFLGEITGNCQHLGAAGATTAEYGYTKEDACFYVMFKGKAPQMPIDTTKLKTKDIVSYAWTWQRDSNLVFDSIEVSVDESNQANRNFHQNVRNLFFQLASKIVRSTSASAGSAQINKVLIGEHQDTLKQLGIPKAAFANADIPSPELRGELVHTDADHQLLFYSSAEEKLCYFANNYNRLGEIIKDFQTDQIVDLIYCINLIVANNDHEQLRKLFSSEVTAAKITQILDLTNPEILRIMQEKMLPTAIAFMLWDKLINSSVDHIPQKRQLELINILAANLPNDEVEPYIELIEKYPFVLHSNILNLNTHVQIIDSEIIKIPTDNYLAFALLNKYGLEKYGNDTSVILYKESSEKLIDTILDKLPNSDLLNQKINEIPILILALELEHYERVLPILTWEKFDPKLLQAHTNDGDNLLMTAIKKGAEEIVFTILNSEELMRNSKIDKAKALEYLSESSLGYNADLVRQITNLPDIKDLPGNKSILFGYESTKSQKSSQYTPTDPSEDHKKFRY